MRETGAMKRVVITGGALLVLLAITVLVWRLPLGPFAILASLGIAAVKGSLVLWIFMETRREGPMVRVFAFLGFGWYTLLLGLVLFDLATRGGGG